MPNRRIPATWLTDGLMWTRDGAVWAIWRVASLPYGLRPLRDKKSVRAAHTALIRTFKGEALYLSTVANTDPASQVERMIKDVDLEQHPEWAIEAEAQLDLIENLPIGQRVGWIAVPMRNEGLDLLKEQGRSALYDFADSLGILRPALPESAVTARRAQSEALRKLIPSAFAPRPATRAEIIWLFDHAKHRGLSTGVPLTPNPPADLQLRGATALVNPVLDEGGQSDLSGAAARAKMNPLTRRYLKVTDPSTNQDSYQVSITIMDLPPGGLAFPGGEWMGRLDESGIEVDWAIRSAITAREKVMTANAQALRELSDQYEQQSAGGLMSGLDQNAAMLGVYDQLLNADELEMEVRFVTILTVGGATAQEAMDAANALRKHLGPGTWGLKTTIEVGLQEDLWWASLPGVATTSSVRQLAQITATSDLAASTFFTSTALGDPYGFPIGIEISAQRVSMVLLDIVNASAKLNTAIAAAACGELGAGKSVFLKTCARHLADRGAQILVIDRTPMGEWEYALGERLGTQVVELSAEAKWSTDPLRILPAEIAATVAQSFLQGLIRFASASTEGEIVGEVLDADYRTEHHLDSLRAVEQHLCASDNPGWAALGQRIRALSRHGYARTAFDPDLPPLDLNAPVLIFRTDRLKLPTDSEMESAHRFEEMDLEKVFGRALNRLVVTLARGICFADRTRLSVLVLDETAWITGTPELRDEIDLWLRDGRKHLAGLLLGSHDAEEDFGKLVSVHLIALRLLMRHRDESLAARGLAWLGLAKTSDSVDQELLDLVTKDLSPIPPEKDQPDPERLGEGIMRDFRNRFGLIKVLAPADPISAAGVFTSPQTRDAA